MSLCSLLYVSESALDRAHAEGTVRQFVKVATKANEKADITGALIFTGTHFAQILEGEIAAIDALMESILRDVRHRNVRIIARTEIEQREFDSWGLAYSGPSYYVSRHIMPLLSPEGAGKRANSASRLKYLMAEFRRIRRDAAA